MPHLIKHILTILFALLVANTFVLCHRDKGVQFDPMDANDYAVMKQNTSGHCEKQQSNQEQKGVTANPNDKHHKSSKVKDISFQFVINIPQKSFVTIAGVGNTRVAFKQKRYRHLFYRDINPPPRYS